MSVVWWLNLIGIAFNTTGTLILAYDVFYFKLRFPLGKLGYIKGENEEQVKRNNEKIKIAMILIVLGGVSQLLALFQG